MNWWAAVGFALLMWFAGPGDPVGPMDHAVAVLVCVVVGLLLGRALA